MGEIFGKIWDVIPEDSPLWFLMEVFAVVVVVGLGLQSELLHVVSWFVWRFEVWLAIALRAPEPVRYPAEQPIATWHLIFIVLSLIGLSGIALIWESREA